MHSSVSSVINSLAAVCLEDFVSPAVFYFKGVKLSERVRRRTAIILGVTLLVVLLTVYADCRSAWVECSSPSICLSVRLFVRSI